MVEVAGSILFLCWPLRAPHTYNPTFVQHIFTFFSTSYIIKLLSQNIGTITHYLTKFCSNCLPAHVSSYVSYGFTQPTVFLDTLPGLPGHDIPYKPRFMFTTPISLLLQLCSSYMILAQFKAVIYNQFSFYRYDLRLSAEFRHYPFSCTRLQSREHSASPQ